MIRNSVPFPVAWRFAAVVSIALSLMLRTSAAHAETGYDAWLRYAPIEDRTVRERYNALPASVVALGDSDILAAARDELVRGIRGMLGRTLRVAKELPAEGTIVL